MAKPMITINSNATAGHQIAEKLVKGYSCQDLDAITPIFSDNAVYRDMVGSGEYGNTLHGVIAIRKHFEFYFKYLMPSHHYEDAIIVGEDNRICASWTLVFGTDLEESKQHRVRGCDFFLIEDGKVIEKCAFLKFSFSTYIAMVKLKLLEALRFKSTAALAR
jgi:hypothetical protein